MFTNLSREDIATIFPQPEKFVLGMKLYKVVQKVRATKQLDIDTQELLRELDAAEIISVLSL